MLGKQIRRWIGVMLMLFLLTGCSSPEPIVGTWEEEITVSVIGIDQPGGEASAVTRFVFNRDGTGSWGTTLLDGSHPEAVREFRYTLEGDILTLSYQEEMAPTEFKAVLEADTLTLESIRGTFYLTRTK